MKRQYISAILAATAIAAGAQHLNKEIIIEREISPTLRSATRMSALPSVVRQQVEGEKLQFSDLTTSAPVSAMVTTLEPATPGAVVERSPYRGYASLGYFPAFNLGASAGYRLIHKPRTSLGAWMQYDGKSYKGDFDATLKRHTVTVGADFTQLFHRAGRLDIKADFTYDSSNRPIWADDPWCKTTKYDTEATWSARRRELAYFASVSFDGFHFSEFEREYPIFGAAKPDGLTQTLGSLKGGLTYFISDRSSVAALVDVDVTHFNHFNIYDPSIAHIRVNDSRTMSLTTLKPAYRYRTNSFSANVGVAMQLTTHSGKTVHVAPDIHLNVKPASCFGIDLRFGGGEHINLLSHLFEENPYMSPAHAFRFSHIPLTADAAFTVGPFSGAWIKFKAAYASANDWLMPVLPSEVRGSWEPFDLRSWQFGAELGWRYSNRISASASYSYSPSTQRHSWYLSPDRAAHLFKISAQYKPIDRLSIDASYDLRANRWISYCEQTIFIRPDASIVPVDQAGNSNTPTPAKIIRLRRNLGNANSLNIGASYEIFDWLTVYARVENILNCRARMLGNLPMQGLHGLVGASIKF